MTDVDGHVLPLHKHLVNIDTVIPIDLTETAAGWLPYSSKAFIVRGTDTHSEIQRVEWRIDGGTSRARPATITT